MKAIFFLVVANGLYASEWVCPNGQEAFVIYYQGAGCSQVEATKYQVNRLLHLNLTHEEAMAHKGIDICHHLWVWPELPEVQPATVKKKNWINTLLHPFKTWQEESVKELYQERGVHIMRSASASKKQTLAAHSIDWGKTYFGQESEVAYHHNRVSAKCSLEDGEPFQHIWMGSSRGAAVTFLAAAYAAKKNLPFLSQVRLILLEGCYASIAHALRTKYQSSFKAAAVENLMALLTAYKKDGVAPIDMVRHFPKNIPVAFITSKKDKQVPLSETKLLVDALIKAGHDDVYLLTLENAPHGAYVYDNAEDAQRYACFVHRLYAMYNLPHITEYAYQGKGLASEAKYAAYNS